MVRKSLSFQSPASQSPASLRFILRLATGLAAAATVAALGAGCEGGSRSEPTPGQTDFQSEDMGGGRNAAEAGGFGSATGAPGPVPPAADAARTAAPGGRTAMVEEADIYRVDNNRLFYLNTYRGFVVYDVADPKKPQRVSRLPIYGYPVEMFVSGNTVYALLRDALYMTQVAGKVQFQRHNVSQLVAIDVSDIANPRVLKTVDIVGELREGVSRKIEDTIYVVSYVSQSYYWGWNYGGASPGQKEQAWVYSFNVADAQNPRLVQQLKIFEGGSVDDHDPLTGGSVSRYFTGVAISATSNALMVVENWQVSSWTPGNTKPTDPWACGSYSGDQRAVVSVVDVSDPAGAIRLHTRFQTRGQLSDQFKQTYVYDEASRTGTYFGIFGRQAWLSAGCSGQSFVQNTLEAWDITDGGAPVRSDSLDFGKPDETVRGTAFDVGRKVAYAITARNIDPLYVLDISDRANLAIRSAIDGLSGDMSLFRLIEGNQFLMGIGRDTSATCTGLQGDEANRGANVAVSVMDVRNLDAIKLVQRRCVEVKNADWVGSQITWNMDQAHKMIGMHSDGQTNVITVPVSYAARTAENAWSWYEWKTAVGIMSWNVGAYDAARPPAEQTVLRNHGTFVHPNGEVKRSIVFTHQGATPRRMMINLSDTHISIADVQDLAAPGLQSVVELAPYVQQIHAFGDHVVEVVQDAPAYWYGNGDGRTEFRVKRASGDVDDAAPVARFQVSQVQSVVPHGDKLVVFRVEQPAPDRSSGVVPVATTEVLVYDLATPTAPRLVGSVRKAGFLQLYYPFMCGTMGGGYWYRYGTAGWTATADAIVFLANEYVQVGASYRTVGKLTVLDLRNPAAPALSEVALPSRGQEGYYLGLVPDGVDASGFFLTYQDVVGVRQEATGSIRTSRYYAERFARVGAGWRGQGPINLPGSLVRTFPTAGSGRAFLTSDSVVYSARDPQGNTSWRSDTRLNLLRGVVAGGRPAAELLDWHRFADQYVSDLVVDGNTLLANVNPTFSYYGYGYGVGRGGGVATDTAVAPSVDQISDRLVAFDLGGLTLDRVYEAPTGTFGVQFMGIHDKKLFVNVAGDGVLAVDISDPAQPKGRQFLRTLGWATHLVFTGSDAYVAAGHFGTYRMSLAPAVALPVSAGN